MLNPEKKMIQMNLQNRKRLSLREQIYGCQGEGREGRNS